jgi:radical SAM superfamily enzyme YgiQ (UPF0313 family)
MSNLGYQAVLGAFLEDERFDARRVFWEGQKPEFPDGGRTLGDFDAVALSVSYQPDMVHLPRLLETVRARRSGSQTTPLLIAGGVAVTINPETVSDLFDLIVLGDAEPVLPLLMDGLASGEDPDSLLDRLVEVPGIYIPSRFGHYPSPDSQYQLPSPLQGMPRRLTPSVLPDLSARPARPAVITDGSEFGRLYLLEVSRGCPAGCLFCAAGTACGPVRFLGMEAFVAEAERGLKYRKTIGLVGTAVSYHPHLEAMAGFLLDRGGSFSPSSIRAEKVTPRLAELLVRAKHKTVSLAPEAGTRSLRASIGKDLTDEQFLTRADILLQAGIPNLKLYFMVGLPGETNSDITGIVELVMKLKDRMMHWGRPRGRVGSVTVSVNPFVPKPRTALERAPVATETVLKERMRRVRAKLGSAGNILVQTGSVRRAYLDALLSLGDRTVADVLDKLPAAGVSLKRLIKIYPAAEQVLFGRESGELPWHFIK